MEEKKHNGIIFIPENEPYFGLVSLQELDKMIVAFLDLNKKIAIYTRVNIDTMTNIQRAATQIVPQSMSLILGIRELVRQGYLYAGITLVRPLIERVATLAWLCDHNEDLDIWNSGWEYNRRPSFSRLIENISSGFPLDLIHKMRIQLNSYTHGDPYSSINSIEFNIDGEPSGYSVGKIVNNKELCDDISWAALGFLIVLLGRVSQIFPSSEMNYKV